MKKREYTILVADDEASFRQSIIDELRREGYRIEEVKNSIELRAIIRRKHYDVILLDLQMVDSHGRFSLIAGIEDLKYLKTERRLQDCEVIVISGVNDLRIKKETMRLGAFDSFEKSELAKNLEPLLDSINGALSQSKTQANPTDDPQRGGDENLEIRYKLQFTVIPTGIYRQFGRGSFAEGLIKYSLTNRAQDELSVTVTTQIGKRSDPQISTVRVMPQDTVYVSSSPLIDFVHTRQIRAIEETALQHTVVYIKDNIERPHPLNTQRIWLHPMTTMCWALENPETGRTHFLGQYIAAWVTPHSPQLEQARDYAAVNCHPNEFIIGYTDGDILSKDQRATFIRTQIKALYDGLKETGGINRIDSSKITFRGHGSQNMQRIQLPEETLQRRTANCIDLSVLFASLIEGAGINAIIVLIFGHAFVGWETWEESGEFEYLETTWLNQEDFETALEQGHHVFSQQEAKEAFQSGNAAVISIPEARRAGIHPMITR